MKSFLLFLSIFAFGSFAADEEQFTIIGSIDRIARNQINVKTPRGSFPISTDEKTEVLKNKINSGVTALKIGDEIGVQCRPDASGKLAAVRISATVVNFAATVNEV